MTVDDSVECRLGLAQPLEPLAVWGLAHGAEPR
jgi:hypothetical protein